MAATYTPCPSCAAQAPTMGNPFQNVHQAYLQPSYTHWPDQSKTNQLLSNTQLKHVGSNPFLYGTEQQGPPPAMQKSCGTALRHDDQTGWHCATAPCYGPKPNDKAMCDVQTGKWYVPTVHGNATTWGGNKSLVSMAPCAIDNTNFYQVGTLGKPTCDRLTGRYYYDNVEGYAGGYDGQSLAAFSTYRYGKEHDPRTQSYRGGMHGKESLTGHYLNSKVSAVAMDRGYTGTDTKVKFTTPDGRLHPALTDMGSFRTRGYVQKNSQIKPVSRIPASLDPAGQERRGGYMATARTRRPSFGTGSPFTPQDWQQAASLYQRPHLITQSDMASQNGRSLYVHRNAHN